METKAWDAVIELARAMTAKHPARERPWIALAFALREQQRIAEARDVLLAADVLHGAESALLHYNLACYYSLLGDQVTAKERLRRACKMDPDWKAQALNDTDLSALWDEISALG
jgi:Tfp pilus assembly protein PilF